MICHAAIMALSIYAVACVEIEVKQHKQYTLWVSNDLEEWYPHPAIHIRTAKTNGVIRMLRPRDERMAFFRLEEDGQWVGASTNQSARSEQPPPPLTIEIPTP